MASGFWFWVIDYWRLDLPDALSVPCSSQPPYGLALPKPTTLLTKPPHAASRRLPYYLQNLSLILESLSVLAAANQRQAQGCPMPEPVDLSNWKSCCMLLAVDKLPIAVPSSTK